jgi:hypothetical protein
VGPASGGWYGVGDIGDDGCEKTGAVLEHLADWAEYSLLGDAFGVAPVLPVSRNVATCCPRISCGVVWSSRCAW